MLLHALSHRPWGLVLSCLLEIRNIRRRLWRRLTGEVKPVSLPSKAGDLVLFDFRINHRASRGRLRAERPEEKKLAIFYACSRNNGHVRSYHKFLASRPNYVYLKDYTYAEDLLEEAEARGVLLG